MLIVRGRPPDDADMALPSIGWRDAGSSDDARMWVRDRSEMKRAALHRLEQRPRGALDRSSLTSTEETPVMNSITLVGRLTHEPETRPVGSGHACRMRLAVDRRTRDGAVFIDIDVFGPVGEACQAHLKKGRLVAVLGRLEQDTWKDRDGSARSRHIVIAATVEFLDRPRPSMVDSTVQ